MGKAVTGLNKPNKTQNFYPSNDLWREIQLPFKASTAMEEGSAIGIEIVTNDVTGNVTLMGTTNATGADFQGILAEPIVSTDSDYATAGKLKSVWVPVSAAAEAYFAVGAGTFTAADVFKTVAFHTDSKSLAVDTKGLGARIVKYISSTKGICNFNIPTSLTA